MKRLDADAQLLNAVRAFDDVKSVRNRALSDVEAVDVFLDTLRTALLKNLRNPIVRFGLRAQQMFAYIVAELGQCEMISEEDSGMLLSHSDMRRPDFRIHTTSGNELLVEVKNFYQKSDPSSVFRLKRSYLQSLQRYARRTKLPLYVAVYWSRWNIWTLTRSDQFEQRSDGFVISLGDAMKRSDLAILGDFSIGTVPPLSLRLTADRDFRRSAGEDGKVIFRVKTATIWAGGREISSEDEQKFAWFLMLYGSWTNIRQPVRVVNDLVEYVEIEVTPEQEADDQNFQFLGPMSSMLSLRYKTRTDESDGVPRLWVDGPIDNVNRLMPFGKQGEVLRLWWFTLVPTYSGLASSIVT